MFCLSSESSSPFRFYTFSNFSRLCWRYSQFSSSQRAIHCYWWHCCRLYRCYSNEKWMQNAKRMPKAARIVTATRKTTRKRMLRRYTKIAKQRKWGSVTLVAEAGQLPPVPLSSLKHMTSNRNNRWLQLHEYHVNIYCEQSTGTKLASTIELLIGALLGIDEEATTISVKTAATL